MSKSRFIISFKQTKKDQELLNAINKIEKCEKSEIIKGILYKVLVEGNKNEEK